MADINPINPSPVFLHHDEIVSGFAGVGGLALGQVVYCDPATGTYLPASAANAATANIRGIVTSHGSSGGFVANQVTIGVGSPAGILEHGYAAGYDFSALAFDAPVFLSNTPGMLATAAGTTSVIVGWVRPTTERDSVTGLPGKMLRLRAFTS